MLVETAQMIPITKLQKELSMLDEIFERFEIADDIKSRMKHYDASKSVSWESIKED